MPTVEGKAYWASVTRPNTTFDPVYQIDLAVDDKTAEEFKGKGVSVKQDERGSVVKFKRKVARADGTKNPMPRLVDSAKNPIDVLPGWHKVGYFPNNSSEDSDRLSPKDKMVNDILIMGRLDVFVEEGKHETIVLNYQSLEEDVIDYNKRFQTGTWTGFSLFFLMILLMSWGLA